MYFEDPQDSDKKFYEATVLRVIDGDTIDVQHNNNSYRIRVEGIDAPESNQPFGWEATVFLHELIHDKEVYISVSDIGKYERHVGKVLDKDFNNIAENMLANGYAWYLPEEKEFDESLKALQTQAQENKTGLWGGKRPIHPKTWRDRKMTMSDFEKKQLKEKKDSYANNSSTPIPETSEKNQKATQNDSSLSHIPFREKSEQKNKRLSIRFRT